MTLPLTRFGNSVDSVFALAGDDENSATEALGWTLSRSPGLLKRLLDELMPGASCESLRIDLQRRGPDAGFTDIEIRAHDLHCIVEAKVGMTLPSVEQLERYAGRIGSVPNRLLVSISDASVTHSRGSLPRAVHGAPVHHLPWRTVRQHALRAAGASRSPIEKLWLRELEIHLENYVTERRTTDNTVYIVSLSRARIDAQRGYTWLDVVRESRYFHPAGKGWPTEPPNYLGFRYDGILQSIHHVEHWEVVDRLTDHHPAWPDTGEPHFLYQLGPAIVPPIVVKSGNIWSARVYAAIDLLLTGKCATVSDAVSETKKRLASSRRELDGAPDPYGPLTVSA